VSLATGQSAVGGRPTLRHNVGVRKVPIPAKIAVAVAVILIGAVGVDYGISIYAEYRLSCSVRAAAHLRSDPFVAIVAFPFLTQAVRGHYDELEIKANAVDQAVLGTASLEATLHAVDLNHAPWLIGPDTTLVVGELESRILIDSLHLGRYLGMSDLMVEAPTREISDATGGTTGSGISDSHGLVFTGTPRQAGFDHRVTVSVDVAIAADDQATLVLTPTGILTGPDTANRSVPADRRDAVLRAFTARLPHQRLPFGVAPTAVGARGSDVIVEGVTRGVAVTLEQFKQS